MEKIDRTGIQIFDKIRGRFSNVSLGDKDAQTTQDPREAKFFNFSFVANGKDFGNVTISIVDNDTLKIYYSKNITSDLTGEEKKEWYNFLKDMRRLSMRNMMRFDTHDISKSSLSMADVKTAAQNSNNYDTDEIALGESKYSKMYGTSKSSYQKFGPTRIIVRHSAKVDEEKRGARSRKINALFIENDQGERFKLPFKKLFGARAMANHVSAGGQVYDDVGKSISEMVNEITDLQPFLRRSKYMQFEDEVATQMVESAKSYYKKLRETLNKLRTRRGYTEYVENFEPDDNEVLAEYNEEEYLRRFRSPKFDDRMKPALPRIHKAFRMNENNKDYKMEFESWADEVTSDDNFGPEVSDMDADTLQDILSGPLEVGPDGINAIGAISNIIDDPTLQDELNELSITEGPNADATPMIKAWIRENNPELADRIGITDLDGEEELGYDPDGPTGESDILDPENDTEFDESIDIARLAGLAKSASTKKGVINPGEFGAFGRKPKGNDVKKGKFKKGPFGAKLAVDEGSSEQVPEFEDTEEGAVKFLEYLTGGENLDYSQAAFIPDPSVPGVWKVENLLYYGEPETAILYMPGTAMGGEQGDIEISETFDEGVMESTELTAILKNAGLKK